MDFKQIEAFVNVVKYRSFSKAADAIFLTQPTISAHIHSLERELDMQLLNRKAKSVSLTEGGEIFYKYAVDMINTREKAVSALKCYGQSMEGVLEIQASSTPGQYMLPRLISEFNTKYPGIRYFVEQSDSGQVIENISQGRGEIGFVGRKGNKVLEYIPLFTDGSVIIAPKTEKFLSIDRNAPIETFIKEPFIQRESGSATLESFSEALDRISVESLNVIARMDSMEAVKRAVSEGLGISVVAGMAVSEEEREKYLIFSPSDLDLSRDFYMVCNERIAMSPVAEAFKEFVLKSFNTSKK